MMVIPPMMHEILLVAYVLTGFTAIFILAEVWRYFLTPPVEFTRKFVHLSCGVLIACFHWIFHTEWPVLLLFGIFSLLIVTSRYFKLFPSIYGIRRSSLGDIYYPISALILFLISFDRPVFYFISMLTLTVSDALAAVLGSIYQRTVYSVETQSKSLEGSTVFFLSTFLIVHIPLLLLLEVNPLQSILIGLQVALVVTCLEAICLNGFDNIIIPFGTYFLLFKLLPMNFEIIAWQIGWQLAIITLLYYVSLRFKTISISGAIVGQLFLCGAFAFGGPNWLIVPLISFGIVVAALRIILSRNRILPIDQKIYQVVAAFHVTAVPGFLFFAHNFSEKLFHPQFWERNNDFFYTLFISAVVSHLCIVLYRLAWLHLDKSNTTTSILSLLALVCYALIIPFGLWLQMGAIHLFDLGICGFILLLSSFSFYVLFHRFAIFQTFPWEFRVQSLSVLIGTSGGWILQQALFPAG